MKKKHNKPIFLSPPHMSGREQHYIREAFDTNWIAPVGPHIEAFEEQMKQSVGSDCAVAVTSGTAAIHLALDVLGVGCGDKVFCSTFTFVASANPILYQGAEPVFIDSEPSSWNMSPEALQKALIEAASEDKLPKAVIVVHLYGQSARMKELLQLCRKYRVPVIEDAAESLGAMYYGQASGSIGDIGIYSFNGNKIITTSGGGMLVTNNTEYAERARFLSTQAKDPAGHYQHSQRGYNYRMSNVLAGIGRAQAEILQERVYQKRLVFERYKTSLPVRFMPEYNGSFSTRWLTVCLLPKGIRPETVQEILQKKNIEARRVWKPLHMQPLFSTAKYYPHKRGTAAQLFETGLCLPSGTNMSREEQEFVIEQIRSCISSTTTQEAVFF